MHRWVRRFDRTGHAVLAEVTHRNCPCSAENRHRRGRDRALSLGAEKGCVVRGYRLAVDDPPRSGRTRALLWVVLVGAVLWGTLELLMGVGVLALCIVGGVATGSLPLALFGVVGELALVRYGAVEARRRRAEPTPAAASSSE